MPINAMIPLSGTKPISPLDLLAVQGSVMQNQLHNVQLQQAQYGLQGRNAMLNAFSTPGALGPDGQLSSQAMSQAIQGGADPKLITDIAHQQNTMGYQTRRGNYYEAMADKAKLDNHMRMGGLANDVIASQLDAHDKAIKAGASPETALQTANQVGMDKAATFAKSGLLGDPKTVDEFMQKVGEFDPVKSYSAMMTAKDLIAQHAAAQKLSTHPVDDKLVTFDGTGAPKFTAPNPAMMNAVTNQNRAETAAARVAAPDGQPVKGWKMYTDNTGSTFRVNENAGLIQKKDGSAWTDVDEMPQGATHIGSNIGVKDNVRTSLVQGASQNALNRLGELRASFGEGPRVSPFFASHPETVLGRGFEAVAKQATMSDKQRNIDTGVGAMLDEAIPVFTGGLRSSDSFRKWLVTQMPNQGDNEATAKEKLRVFEENVKGTQTAFRSKFMTTPGYKAPGETGTPSVVKATAQSSGEAMPKTRDALVAGKVYQTARGPAKWNGSSFETAE